MVNLNAQFDKAVAIVRSLPADGPLKPSTDQQLEVSASRWRCCAPAAMMCMSHVHLADDTPRHARHGWPARQLCDTRFFANT